MEYVSLWQGREGRRVMGLKKGAFALALALAFALAVPVAALAVDDSSGANLTTGSVDLQKTAKKKTTAKKKSAKKKYAFTKQTVKMVSYSKVVSDGVYYIALAKDTRRVVSVKNARAYTKSMAGSKTQLWRLQFSKGDQAYHIYNVSSGKALSVQGNRAYEVAPSTSAKNQQWRIISSSKGYKLAPVSNIDLRLSSNGKYELEGGAVFLDY